MKKLVIGSLFLMFAQLGFSQDPNTSTGASENELKNFRFGLKVVPTLSWLRPDDPKKLTSEGVKAKFGYGLIMEFRLSRIISLYTGLEFNYDGGQLTYKDSAFYLVNKDEIMLVKDGTYPKDNDNNNGVGSGFSQYRLVTRTYNLSYVTIPLALKMKTKEINMITYYGMFGFNFGVRTRCRVNDDKLIGIKVTPNSSFDTQNNDITSDMGLFKLGLNVGGGGEWSLAGSTSLVFGLNYYRGFLNALPAESNHLRSSVLFGNKAPVRQAAYLDGLALTIGVLF